MTVTLTDAAAKDASAIATLRTAVAQQLTHDFGPGHWSSGATEKGILYALRNSRVLLARNGREILGVLQLSTKKPWAIDKSYFSDCHRPLYLTAMAVAPAWQRRGVGRGMLDEVPAVARRWPADAIRLDAYDHEAGAGGFYAKCGFREVGRVTYRNVPLIYYELAV